MQPDWNPADHDVWSSPERSRVWLRLSLIFIGVSSVFLLGVHPSNGISMIEGLFIINPLLLALGLGPSMPTQWRLSRQEPTLLLGLRNEGIIVYSPEGQMLVPYRFVKRARARVSRDRAGKTGHEARLEFRRGAPAAVRALEAALAGYRINLASAPDAEAYAAYVTARVAGAASTPNIRATSIS